MKDPPPAEPLTIAVRAYAVPPVKKKRRRRQNQKDEGLDEPKGIGRSDWTLIFDTETAADAAQQLRLGVYQLRRGGRRRKQGIFYDPLSLDKDELALLRQFANDHRLEVSPIDDFVDELFYPYVYDRQALCVGFNLPFDFSRLAASHGLARGDVMRGGFSYRLSANPYRARLQIKHLNGRAAFIRFAGRARKPDDRTRTRRGYFLDLRTLAGALLGGSWSLGTLGDQLQTKDRKKGSDEHGKELTREYLEYAVNDVQVTWECYQKLQAQYDSYKLTQTYPSSIYSEAGLGKAYLREMGIRAWKQDLRLGVLGAIMSAYYGGRSEVHIRRQIARVLYCDFKSMYPTVCTLMGLWRFVIAEDTTYQDATDEVREFLQCVTLEDLQRPDTWQSLPAIVQVLPDADILPVRARYSQDEQRTIGLNYLTSDRPLWFTLPDCVSSKLLTGKVPTVLRAIRFTPTEPQATLRPINIAGNPHYRIDPMHDDFYKRLIDLRTGAEAAAKAAGAAGDQALAAQQEAEAYGLKICANATSYGIFAELNVTELNQPQALTCYGADGQPFLTNPITNLEEPGSYFHPLLGTLITGAARLMLAMVERLTEGQKITWAFCDTDSMALSKLDGMSDEAFLEAAQSVAHWFRPLNPYEDDDDLFEVEDANYRLVDGKLTKELEPLYCFAISAKRYALFNLDKRGRPVTRKASAHGLGHLRPPYGEDEAPASIPAPTVPLKKLEVERWQYDLSYRIVEAALGPSPEQVRLDDLPGFDRAAVSRYAATTRRLLKWFKRYNHRKPYREQVRPNGFLLAYQTAWGLAPSGIRPVSPFDKDISRAVRHCFDRETSQSILPEQLKTYREALAQYHLHPESKFLGGDYVDSGVTARRHIRVSGVEHVGKEANRWEEQFHLGPDVDARIEYGLTPEDLELQWKETLKACRRHSRRAVARAVGLSHTHVGRILNRRVHPSLAFLARLRRALQALEVDQERRVTL